MKELVKKVLFLCFAVIIIFGLGYYAGMVSGNRDLHNASKQINQINRDITEVRTAQLEAAERAERLQGELSAATKRAKRAESRAGRLQTRLDGIINVAGNVAEGIDDAQTDATDGAELLRKNLSILRSIQENGRIEN